MLLALLRRSVHAQPHRQRLAHRRKATAPGLDLGAQFANKVGDGTDTVQALGDTRVSSKSTRPDAGSNTLIRSEPSLLRLQSQASGRKPTAMMRLSSMIEIMLSPPSLGSTLLM